ncbi:hypothetical protein HYC85_031544 [Camellia sinensis]|uniref:non-specific serine/threonine protein kinase n=1 Tax=Camellia sinensis TaxID=4442 RepID=A0A7J7FRR2_CAMSI|nr:hypothetical protein HYC85_031544 [Camellia sinensis]
MKKMAASIIVIFSLLSTSNVDPVKYIPSFSLFLFFLFLSSLKQQAHQTQTHLPPSPQVTALGAIRSSLIDPNGNLSDWNRGDPCTSNWTGVLCYNTTMRDGYLHVRELQLLTMNLSGSLSPELGRLSHMQILDVMWNQISGSIPKEVGNITSLELLLLNGNQLTGPLPDEIGNLPKLDRIQIDQNQISGPIPKSFAKLNKTKHFHMNNNSLSGQIPPELSALPNLVHMLLDNNNLSGYLPPELANLPSLLILSLRNCSLQGPIPDLSGIPHLAYIDLSLNQLNGSIPPYKLSENMTTIDLSGNNLTGPIPANFSGLPLLQTLSLLNNSLSGSVPASIWQNWTSNGNKSLIVDLQNNMLSNISGSVSVPANVTVRLQGNPICSNTNLVQFCGPLQNETVSHTPSATNSSDNCPVQSCPYEYSPNSPVPCFCAAPLIVGYRLKSPGFRDFVPYWVPFEVYLTTGLELNVFQLEIVSVFWEEGPRLRMDLKIFPVYVNTTSSYVFNGTEVQRIRSMFTGWHIPDSDIFGPYELIDFPLWGPYKDVSKITIKIDGVKDFSYQEMALATNNFDASSQVGQGGYGKVYKGILADGTVVAIKRALEGSLQGEKEFLTEIELLSRLHHRNLVSLLGYCDEEGEQMLVYEFMSNGTLRDHLSGAAKEPPGFAMRLRIALGSSKGILYLHTEADPPIFHRDVKASNILLDSKFTAKVADFGLSRLAPVPDIEGMTPGHVSTVVKGTPGYLDPEYFLTHKLTDKSDVYSLGVVFLELLTGMHPISHGKNIVREVNSSQLLSSESSNVAYRSGMIFSVIDEKMGSYPSDCVERFVNLALKCCQDETDNRPSMSEVVRELESIWLMMPESDTKTSESLIANPGKDVTPPSSASDLKNHAPYVSGDISGSDLISGVVQDLGNSDKICWRLVANSGFLRCFVQGLVAALRAIRNITGIVEIHATTDYESIRKFISRAWPLVLYANIGCYVESDKLLNGNQLTGPLPDEIGYLPNLDRIQIDQNQISGPIPKSFANLSKTKHFSHMNNNSLSGQIPPELSMLPNLVHMLLDNNNLSGYLPPELANLPRLLILQLDNNHFDGATIPDSYGNMSKLLKLSLLNNSLNGSVPATIWQNRTFNGNASLIVNLQNNMLSNISGSVSVPANVTVRLQGNPICLNTNLVQFCGPQNENKTVSHTPSATNSSDDCKVQSCTYEYAPNSPCFCAAPLIVGYRLKSPAFRDFEPYWVPFERCLTTDLELNPFQLEIVSVSWEEGYRLRMNLKIFPIYVDNTSSHFFNTTEVQRIRSMFTGWHIDDTEIFGPYELLDFPLRDPYIDVIPSKSGIGKGALAGIVVGTFAGAVILSAVVSLLMWRLHMNKYAAVSKRLSKITIKIDGVKDFSYQEMALATNNFDASSQVGQGGYGKVYKGILADGTVVAIKRALEGSLQGEKEFLTEIELLSRLHHRNLVSLLGYCDEEGEQMLVYEFMSNGTLRDHLSGAAKEPPGFAMRLRIALGSSKGILYLHTEADPPIFHRDVKASNILLDSKFTAKVADFGLSRLAPGYVDPEYFLTHKLTDKSDVYSLGVVFLELLTGMHPISHGKNIVREVKVAYRFGMIFSVIDKKMGSYPSDCVERFVNLALKCCQDETDNRPSMSEVVRELESIWLMMLESDTKTSESLIANPGKVVTPPLSSSDLKNHAPYVSGDISGNDLISGVDHFMFVDILRCVWLGNLGRDLEREREKVCETR